MEARPAATLILARDLDPGIEVLVERRSPISRFAPGFVVFPGGVVEPGDADLATLLFGDPAEAARACVVRELHEECGILLAADGPRLGAAGESPEAAVAAPPRESLVEVARWLAPAFLEVRFDAHFFAAAAPGGIEPRPDGIEIETAWWATPRDVLEASVQGTAPLMWPTLVTLEALRACASVDDVMGLRLEPVAPPAPGTAPPGAIGVWQRPGGRRVGR